METPCSHPEVDRIWGNMGNILGLFRTSYSIYSRMAVDAHIPTPPNVSLIRINWSLLGNIWGQVYRYIDR